MMDDLLPDRTLARPKFGNLPDRTQLLRKLDGRSTADPDLTPDETLDLIRRYGGEGHVIQPNGKIALEARGGHVHDHPVTAWARMVLSGDLTLNDIYSGHVPLPDDLWELQKSTVLDPAALIMLGVPEGEIQGWQHTKIRYAPHIIKNVTVTLRPEGEPAITAQQYLGLWEDVGANRIEDRSGIHGYLTSRVDPAQVKRWYSRVKDLRALGHHPDNLCHLPGWVTSDWSAEAMIRFEQNGISPVGADGMEKVGVTRSDLIVAVVKGEMPVEWAIAASEISHPV